MKIFRLADQKNKARELADQVNPLVEAAFGRGFRGDYHFCRETWQEPLFGEGLYSIGKFKGGLWKIINGHI